MEKKRVAFSWLFLALVLAVFHNVVMFGKGSTITYTWVSTSGTVLAHDTEPAQGWMLIFADVGYWADGGCAFTVPPLGSDNILISPAPPFNFTLYFTKLLSVSTVELNYNGFDLLIAGLWGINSVENPDTAMDIYAVTQNMTTTPGELGITDSWTYFTINLEGYKSIQGNITSYCVREVEASGKRYPYGDMNYDFRIDMRDIGAFAKAFGSPLGYERYNFLADINFDLKIDIRDVAVCASRFGVTY